MSIFFVRRLGQVSSIIEADVVAHNNYNPWFLSSVSVRSVQVALELSP